MHGVKLTVAAAAIVLIASHPDRTTLSADEPRAWAPKKHGLHELFLDDVGVESVSNLKRVLHQPTKHPANPILKPDQPWESRCQVYGTAVFDPIAKKIKLWYLTTPPDRGNKPLIFSTHERAPHTTLAAYAESTDGITWTKPALNSFSYDGNKANNLVDIGKFNCEGIAVLRDSDPNPNRLWKAAYWDHGSGGWEMRDGKPYAKPGPADGFCVAFSSDGIHWKPSEHNPVIPKYCDTNQNVVLDWPQGKYVAFSRFGFGRKLARSESTDFEHWSEPQIVLACDEADGPGAQIYGAGVDFYQGHYIATLWIYHEGTDGTIDTQLATSRDGVHWTRVADRAVWLPLGETDSWEGGMVRSVGRFIYRGDQLYVYYCGVHGPHAGPKFQNVERKHPTAIGLATLRRDGFVSFTAGDAEGTLLTKPFTSGARELHLNFDASKGKLRITLCDKEGKPMQIAGKDISQTFQGDHVDRQVDWRPLPIGDKPVRLKFELTNASLYSYWVK